MEEKKKDGAAAELKEQGNNYFKKGDFHGAIKSYTSSMEHDPSNSVLPINRAMAYLKLDMYTEAEADCSLGILLDKKNVKAHWRRGIARRSLGRLEESKRDFELALVLDPSNKAVKEELIKVKELIVKSGKDSKPASVAKPLQKSDTIATKSTSQQPQIVSSKRVAIKEVSNGQPSELFEDILPKKSTGTLESVAESKPARAPATEGSTLSFTTPKDFALSMPMTVPATTMELQRDWKSYSKDKSRLYEYLKLIKPESMPNLFKSSFESEYLTSMLAVFQEFYIPSEEPALLYRTLANLIKVQRIDLSLMFMTASEKKELASIFKHLAAHAEKQDAYNQQDLTSLASKFKTTV
ncbi:RNA polymerase II-associated protein 3 [Entomortierella parvispora]|uniref:RNA polymerase II-associated protein 3 n=1 Tax=Entomortierella parvispora TaxID=205924 RepID=A0A9P3HC13_9FUNG|nr:RNA polymerase II-associated protein 3 [Entomortierella parvispora]